MIQKPAGVLVHRQHRSDETAIVQLMRDQLGRKIWLAHRLDRATSGCLVIALDPAHVAPLANALANGQKTYLALVRGQVQEDEFTVDRALKDDRGRMKEAQTRFRILASSPDPRCSLVEARPKTGRTHQIRRHLVGLSHPILGDSKHGDTRENRRWRENWGLPRLALHCRSIAFQPFDTPVEITAPLPADLRGLLQQMPWWEEVQHRI